MVTRPPGRSGRRFVLVTGTPRSGTTGVGTALAHAPGAASLYEPLNPESGLRRVRDYFVLPPTSDAEETALRDLLADVQRVSVRTHRGVWPTDPVWKKAVKQVTGSTSRTSAVRIRLDPRVHTVIWKDPFAALLVPWVVEHLDVPAVVTVRPPEALAASFKRLGWHFDVARLVHGLRAVHEEADYLDGMEEPAAAATSPVEIGALLWRLVHGFLHESVLAGDHDHRERVSWVNSRALLQDPQATYARLYRTLDLALTPAAREKVDRDYRDEGAGVPAVGVTHDAHRNVQQANAYWSSVLDAEEVVTVRRVTEPVRARLEAHLGPLA